MSTETTPLSPMSERSPSPAAAGEGTSSVNRTTVTACVSADSWADAVQAAAAHLASAVGPVVAIARLDGAAISLTPTGPPLGEEIQQPLAAIAAAVFNEPEGWSLQAGAFAVRAVVSREDGQARDALVGLVTQAPQPGHLSAISAALSAASSRELAVDRNREAETAGHVLDLADRLHTASDEADLFSRLAERIRESLAAETVAIGVRRGERFLMEAASPVSTLFDDRESRVLEAAFAEVQTLGQAVAWPPTQSLDRPARRAFQSAAELREAETVWAVPLEDARGQVDVIALVWAPAANDTLPRIAAYWNPTLASTVSSVRAARASWWERLKATISDAVSERGVRIAVGTACLVGAVLAFPLPYQSACECRLEPFQRRFVAAPFAATLKDVHVEPGDVVEADSLLAELDEREIEWELAAIEAELGQADKRRSAALASASLAESQIAQFDGERLQARRDLLIRRKDQLMLRSPIGGIVVDGDLARATGMPLEQGQSLYEVAPLDSFLCEVHVPEFDIHEIAVGQPVKISLDARPGQTLTGLVKRVRPRAEIWDDSVGFVAEVVVENSDRTLRPGMSGDARVRTKTHPLARNLFHRAYGKWRRGW